MTTHGATLDDLERTRAPDPARFDFFSDPCHGWLRVPMPVLDVMNVRPSSCSYRNGDWAYLEEDCDAPRFLRAWEQVHGCAPVVVEREPSRQDSHIRRYAHFSV